MKNELNLMEMLEEAFDMDKLEQAIMNYFEESIDYEEIAAELCADIDIAEAVKTMLLPF